MITEVYFSPIDVNIRYNHDNYPLISLKIFHYLNNNLNQIIKTSNL